MMSFYKNHGSRKKKYRKDEFSTISDPGGLKSIYRNPENFNLSKQCHVVYQNVQENKLNSNKYGFQV